MIVQSIYLILLFCSSYFVVFHINLWLENRNDILSSNSDNNKKIHPISLIIPAYNEEDVIGKTLENLKGIDYPSDKMEIIVVDDGSTDKTYEIARKFKSNRLRVYKKDNHGKAAALNFGVSKAKNDFVAVMDADSLLEKDSLKNCMRYFDSGKVAAVTSCILCTKNDNFWERMQNIEMMLIASTRKLQEYANTVQATPGPLSIYRKGILVDLDGFDEENLVEDIEIAWRILKNGYEIKMALDASVYSIYPNSLKSWWKQRLRWSIGGIQTLVKYFSSFLDRETPVGNFLVPSYMFGYGATVIGVGIFLYLLLKNIVNTSIYVLRSFLIGFNPFQHFELSYLIDINIILGFIVFFTSLFLLKISFDLHKKRPKWRDMMLFLFVYPIFFPIINLFAIYKYYKGERGWLTK